MTLATADGPLSAHPPHSSYEIVRVALEQSDRVTVCPYKGTTTYRSIPGTPDAAWSYDARLPESARLAGYVSFDGEGIGVSES